MSTPSCPSGFTFSPINTNSCIVDKCPPMFELRVKEGMPSCVYKPSPDVFFTLKQTGLPVIPGPQGRGNIAVNVESMPPELRAKYQELLDDYTAKSAEAVGKLEKTALLQNMFKDLQAKENVRDQAPDAYEQSRIAYYTTLNGESWLEGEKQRIAKAEAEPKANQYLTAYQDVSGRLGQQQLTYDIIKGVKDKMLSMKDDFQYTTQTFNKQIDELKSQINIERNKHAAEKEKNFSWLDTILNVIITFVTIILIFVIGKKLYYRNQSAYTPYDSYY